MEDQPSRILIVDDERDTCANLSDILTDLGYQVDVAFDGASALELVRETHYDIALLDLKMPGMSGLELYREIKRVRSGTVAVIVTAYATSETAAEALQAGAWKVLAKPVETAPLLKTLEHALEQPTVLVVDDDRDFCESLWDVLRERGYRTSLAHTAQEASRHIKSHSFDVILIDMVLPEAGGRSVFDFVRENSPAARTILVTGHRSDLEDTLAEVRKEGADGVCYKPFDVGQLIRMIRELSPKK